MDSDQEKRGLCATQTWDASEKNRAERATPVLHRSRHPLEMVALLALLIAMALPLAQTKDRIRRAGECRSPAPSRDKRMKVSAFRESIR